jgi:hypothetical protein
MQERRPVLNKHQRVVAEAVAALLEPILTEMNQELDIIATQMQALLVQLAALEARIGAAGRRDGPCLPEKRG